MNDERILMFTAYVKNNAFALLVIAISFILLIGNYLWSHTRARNESRPECRTSDMAKTATQKDGDVQTFTFKDKDWIENWDLQRSENGSIKGIGLDNSKVVHETFGGVKDYLQVSYPKGSASPSTTTKYGAPKGGAGFYAQYRMAPSDRLHMRYYLRFADNFDFVKGGKLPGLYGGTGNSGGNIPDGTDGFSSRIMWRENGEGEVYAYLPASTDFGTSLGRGCFMFERGKWYSIEQELSLNKPGSSDGYVNIWVDGKPKFHAGNLNFRTTDALKINGVFFDTFFGGDDTSWVTPVDTHIDFGNFAISRGYIGK